MNVIPRGEMIEEVYVFIKNTRHTLFISNCFNE